jgi:hypothetical protein
MITGKTCISKYGNPDPSFEKVWMEVFEVPEDLHTLIKPLPGKIYCNKDLIQPLFEAMLLIQARHLEASVLEWGGCFNIRVIRGYEQTYKDLIAQERWDEADKYLSIHSWAVAVDLNESTNKLGQPPTINPLLVSCFTEVGFDWGGNFTRKDGMHFQLSSI